MRSNPSEDKEVVIKYIPSAVPTEFERMKIQSSMGSPENPDERKPALFLIVNREEKNTNNDINNKSIFHHD